MTFSSDIKRRIGISPCRLGERRELPNGARGRTPAINAFLAYFGVRKFLVERKCDFFAPCKAKNWHFHTETMHLGTCIAQTPGPITGTYGSTAGLILLAT